MMVRIASLFTEVISNFGKKKLEVCAKYMRRDRLAGHARRVTHVSPESCVCLYICACKFCQFFISFTLG